MNDAQIALGRARDWPRREVMSVLVLVVVHEVLRRSLAGDAIVSALFAPSGPHAWTTLLLGLTFVATRVALFVGVPGWLAGRAVSALWEYARHREAH
jgi:hypothetical protein